jgi:UDP-GalNAc:undecaprenyl-phosphate GalNAc-1-phosphate transferase
MSDLVRKGQTSRKRIAFRAMSVMWLLAGFTVSYIIASMAQEGTFNVLNLNIAIDLTLSTFTTFTIITLVVRYVRRFALVNLWAIVAFVVLAFGAIQILIYSALMQIFSPIFHIVFYILTIGTMSIWVRMIKKIQYLRLAYVPFGITEEVVAAGHSQLDLIRIEKPDIAILPGKLNGIVVDTREPLSDEWVRFLAACRLNGLRVYQAEELFEGATGRISLSHLSSGIVDDFSGNMTYQVLKRLLDLLIVVAACPFILLFMIITAIAVRIETPGPALFIQDRVAQGGRKFKILKFRSMTVDSEGRGSQFTGENDKRITRVGWFIRRFRLDEIPQFWNIFKGEMSLIGPRPEQPEFVDKFRDGIPFYDYRHTVKPGITGWAQVTLGYVADEKSTWDKLEYDLYYIKHQSFWLDMLIAMKTVRTVITGFGAR